MAKEIILVIGRSMTEQEIEALTVLYKKDELEFKEEKIKTAAELQKWKKDLNGDSLVAVVIPQNFNKTMLLKMIASTTSPKGESIPFIYPSYDTMKRFICFMQYALKFEANKAV
ncbi:MAG: hypothetical protein HOD92_07310 [Deltaproteobacteria bacterium]|jgi:hypothetical protein|nr:hypothetical protein [Deltaproteobacteria bacterium]MBT4527948.1 hypothetical protein [Deltaproteobacteria bacterium]